MPKLKLLAFHDYAGVDRNDPLRFYYWPILRKMFKRRTELCLAQCSGGQRILEVGFGAGITFPNLNEMYQEIYGLDLNAPTEEVANVFKAMGIETHLQNGNVLSMPYEDNFFDTVLLISILEHLKPHEQLQAFGEIRRVLKPNGQVIYGVPVERRIMVFVYRLMGFNIREHHFSTERQVCSAAESVLHKVRVIQMQSTLSFLGPVYEVGHFIKSPAP